MFKGLVVQRIRRGRVEGFSSAGHQGSWGGGLAVEVLLRSRL